MSRDRPDERVPDPRAEVGDTHLTGERGPPAPDLRALLARLETEADAAERARVRDAG